MDKDKFIEWAEKQGWIQVTRVELEKGWEATRWVSPQGHIVYIEFRDKKVTGICG